MSFQIFNFASFKEVADKAIVDIQDSWVDPFKEPIVLFSSPNVKKWFTKYWVQRKGVVANVQTPDMENFLWKAMDPKENEFLLKPEVLQQLILATLKSKIDNKQLVGDYAGLADYFSQETEVDKAALNVKIADLSITMAGKFREYEFAFYDDMGKIWNVDADVAKWQKALYEEILGADGVLAKATDKFNQERLNDGQAVMEGSRSYTLPGLYQKRINAGELNFESLKKSKIYLIGLFSVGKFHRDMFRLMGEIADVSLYIPTVECTEQPEWTRFAQENLALWNSGKKSESKKSLADISKIEIASAPSKLREMENLFQNVWKTIAEDKIRLDEMLVLIPNLEEYRPHIERAFAGRSLQMTYGNSSESASMVTKAIGHFMNMADTQEINRVDFLGLIRNPLVKKAKGLTEDDCDAFEKWINDVNIYREDLKQYEEGIAPTPVNPMNLWSAGTKRLLLSYLTSNQVSFGEGNDAVAYTPYRDIASSNSSLVAKFCDLLDDVRLFIAQRNLFASANQDEDGVSKIPYWKNIDIIKEWLEPREFADELPVYRDVLRTLYGLNWNRYACDKDIDFELIRFVVQNSLTGIETRRGKFLLDGLNFAKFTTESFVPIKKVFMVGMNSQDFPGRTVDSTLDLRIALENHEGLPDKVAQNRNAFFNELVCADQVYISYQGYDAKGDAELYPSSLISEFMSIRGLKKPTNTLGFDFNDAEGIPYSLRRRYRRFVDCIVRSGNYIKNEGKLERLKNKPEDEEKDLTSEDEEKDLTLFLTNPFEYQIKKVLRIYEDKDASLNNFETIEMDNLLKSSLDSDIFESLCLDLLDTSNLATEKMRQDFNAIKELLSTWNAAREDLLRRYDDIVVKKSLKAALEKSQKLIRECNDVMAAAKRKAKELVAPLDAKKVDMENALIDFKTEHVAPKVSFVVDEFVNKGTLPFTPSLKSKIKNDLSDIVTNQLIAQSCMLTSKEMNVYLTKICSGTVRFKHFVSLYIKALLLAEKDSSEKTYHLCVLQGDGLAPKKKKLILSPKKAKEILDGIRDLAHKQRFHANIPCDVIDKKDSLKNEEDRINESTSLESYCEKLDNTGFGAIWAYPSEETKLFSREDWGLEDWPKPLSTYFNMVRPLWENVAE